MHLLNLKIKLLNLLVIMHKSAHFVHKCSALEAKIVH